ncbi:Ubiquitin carboxyl-terminal hydrolase 8 [Taenia crassiceps]|uniref:Ubiquitin carboxyl-terminal hydrolase n=1 Tax=Taenia crassiceps TaxID=6207 RepID=A0ABR4QM41_9CEST
MLRNRDEESAFVYYGRGLSLFAGIEAASASCISRELKTQYESAKDAYSRLRENLRLRYEMEQSILVLNDLPVCNDQILSESSEREPKQFPGRWMPPTCLYDAIAKGEQVFLIDVRSKEEYSRKKISKIPQINLAVNIIYGQTINSLEKKMDDAQRGQWKLHESAKVIVLFDRDSGGELIEKPGDAENFSLHRKHPLKLMYDTLVTYNAEKMNLPPTVFLSGGFEEFEKRYPSFVSSTPTHSYSSRALKLTGQIDYPIVSDKSGCMLSSELSSYGNSYLEPGDPIGSTKSLSYCELTKLLKANESLEVSSSSSNEPNSKSIKSCSNESSHEPVVDRSTKPQLSVSTASPNRRLVIEDAKKERNNIPEISHSKKFQTAVQIDKSRGISACSSKPNVSVIPSSALRRGLKNMGNTCYMNSTLQCLLHTPHLWYFFVSRKFRGHLVQSFAKFVCEMTNPSSIEAYLPNMLKETFGSSHSMFADGQQQDSHEFLMILLDSLHEELNRSEKAEFSENHAKLEGVSVDYLADLSWSRNRARDDSVILDWFNGQLLSTVQCLTCNRCSHAFDEFMYLSVSIQGSDSTDLMKCIEEFFESEALSGENLWWCPQCKIPCEALKTFGIWRPPEYLIIHLKRFRSYIACEKINSYVHFPLTGLSLSDFTKNIAVSDCIYDLYGVINHHGSVQSGHYTAFCFDLADHRWWNFDDSRVTELSEADILTPAAYVLFYKRSRASTKIA